MAAPHNNNIKGKILESATRLLQEKSFQEITLSQISKEAGVTKGSIYYYYKTKDDILYDIADGYLEVLYHDLMVWIEDENKDTSFPRLIRYALKRGVDDPGKNLRIHLTVDAIAGNATIREKLLKKYDSFREIFAEKVSERKEGADGQYYAWLILTVVDGLLIQTLLGNPNLDADKFIEQFVREVDR